MSELDRIRWQCRRGMLELDLLLQRFLDGHLAGLSPGQLDVFRELLEYPDGELLDMVMARAQAPTESQRALLQLMRAC
jgi:antitoxin CptB